MILADRLYPILNFLWTDEIEAFLDSVTSFTASSNNGSYSLSSEDWRSKPGRSSTAPEVISSINIADGSFYTELPKLTNSNLKPYEKIQMSRSFISDIDRSCYTINSQYKYRPELVTLWCATMLFCFAGYFLYAIGRKNAFNETYTIGRMSFWPFDIAFNL